MGCNCGKKNLATQPKKIIKTPPRTTSGTTGTTTTRRFIRRAAK
jgi:hypothetical protein